MAKSLWCAFQSHVATAQRALIMGSSYLVLKVAHLELKADLLKDLSRFASLHTEWCEVFSPKTAGTQSLK